MDLQQHIQQAQHFYQIEQFDNALMHYDAALTIRPTAQIYFEKGAVLQMLMQDEQALTSYRCALMLDPMHTDCLYNMGFVLQKNQRHAHALLYYERLIALYTQQSSTLFSDTDLVNLFVNSGIVLQKLRCYDQAIRHYDNALKIDQHHVTAHYNLSFCLLAVGDFVRGWQEYEWRINNLEAIGATQKFEQERWTGTTSLKDKTIFLYAEQGFGDAIQFCRYIKDVAALGAIIILGVSPALGNLFAQLHGINKIITPGQMLPPIDYHARLMSLPFALKSDDPHKLPAENYLYSDPIKVQYWKNRLGEKRRPRVGLVWTGGRKTGHDATRSIGLSPFMPLLSLPVDFVCLQQELRDEDKRVFAQCPMIKFFDNELTDFVDTAALIELMDVVVTVDTSVAHLAGAMGKPVWILLPWAPDWRWQLAGDKTAWYHSARLFRQTIEGDWVSVIADVKKELSTLLLTSSLQ